MCVSISVSSCIYRSVFISYSNLGHMPSPTLGIQKVELRRRFSVCLFLSFPICLSLSVFIFYSKLGLLLVCKKCSLGDVFLCLCLSFSISVTIWLSLSVFLSYSNLEHMPPLGMQKVWLRRRMCVCLYLCLSLYFSLCLYLLF